MSGRWWKRDSPYAFIVYRPGTTNCNWPKNVLSPTTTKFCWNPLGHLVLKNAAWLTRFLLLVQGMHNNIWYFDKIRYISKSTRMCRKTLIKKQYFVCFCTFICFFLTFLFQRYESWAVCSTNTRPTMLHRLVGNTKFTQVVANHLWLKQKIRLQLQKMADVSNKQN